MAKPISRGMNAVSAVSHSMSSHVRLMGRGKVLSSAEIVSGRSWSITSLYYGVFTLNRHSRESGNPSPDRRPLRNPFLT